MNRRNAQLAITAMASGFSAQRPVAQELPLLVVSGRIRRTNDADHKRFRLSESQFMALPQQTIVTATVWTPRSRFEGPLLSDVLRLVGAQPGEIHLRALNDYTISIPWDDMERYGVILAHSRNGQRMAASTYGPLWLMYPRDRFPDELSGPVSSTKYIWQVKAIEIR